MFRSSLDVSGDLDVFARDFDVLTDSLSLTKAGLHVINENDFSEIGLLSKPTTPPVSRGNFGFSTRFVFFFHSCSLNSDEAEPRKANKGYVFSNNGTVYYAPKKPGKGKSPPYVVDLTGPQGPPGPIGLSGTLLLTSQILHDMKSNSIPFKVRTV